MQIGRKLFDCKKRTKKYGQNLNKKEEVIALKQTRS